VSLANYILNYAKLNLQNVISVLNSPLAHVGGRTATLFDLDFDWLIISKEDLYPSS